MRSAESPESFANDLNDSFGKAREMTAMISRETVLKRAPSLAEVGNVAVLMASDYASPMTATVANMTCGSIVD
jgi:3-oxoacyl-[acyl-carrier protein] reductase